MKTHAIADMLDMLAKALRSGPNLQLEDMHLDRRDTRSRDVAADVPMALSALVALSKFDKTQWRSIILEYDLPIEVKLAESSRDVVGKILRHLEKSPESRKKLKAAVQRNRSEVSPELMNALNFLLK